jgi:hypothetical protein
MIELPEGFISFGWEEKGVDLLRWVGQRKNRTEGSSYGVYHSPLKDVANPAIWV